MELLDFECKINNEGIKVKHIIITYNGYEYEYNKIHKRLVMKPYDMCPDDIYIYIKNDVIENNIGYRDVLRFNKDGLYYEIESFNWIEFYDIETQQLFMEYISKYYIQPTIKVPFNLSPPKECLFLEKSKRCKYSKNELKKINKIYNYEQSILEPLMKKNTEKNVFFNLKNILYY